METRIFETAIIKMERGKEIIEEIMRMEKNIAIVLFPDEDVQLINTAYSFFSSFIHDYDYAYIFSTFELLPLDDNNIKVCEMKTIEKEDMECILLYVSVNSFNNIKIISFRDPFHGNIKTLINYKDITLDKLVCRCMYGIRGDV